MSDSFKNDSLKARELIARDLPALLGEPSGTRLIPTKLLPFKGITMSVGHLRRLWTIGKFPKPIQLSARRLAWYESDLDAWIAARHREAMGGR